MGEEGFYDELKSTGKYNYNRELEERGFFWKKGLTKFLYYEHLTVLTQSLHNDQSKKSNSNCASDHQLKACISSKGYFLLKTKMCFRRLEDISC